MITISLVIEMAVGAIMRVENSRLNPSTGLSRFQSGVSASDAVLNRFWMAPASNPARAVATRTGPTHLSSTRVPVTA